MAIWGKLLGGAFGFMIGGPLGALIGAVFGHNLDAGMQRLALEDHSSQSEPGLHPGDSDRVQMVFFTATFSVMGHLAKSDGRVSPDEIAWAEGVMDHMDLSPELRQAAIKLFNEGKQPGFELDPILNQFRKECRRRSNLVQMFLEIQIQAVLSDGVMASSEEKILLHIADLMGVSEPVFRQLERLVRISMGVHADTGSHRSGRSSSGPGAATQGMPLQAARELLGVKQGAGKADVKRVYRRLMSQHHPDKLIAKGLPEEMVKLATEKTQQIQKAYAVIKEAEGWN